VNRVCCYVNSERKGGGEVNVASELEVDPPPEAKVKISTDRGNATGFHPVAWCF
jgi:hypothetical protein